MSDSVVLLLDIGNSRCKWLCWKAGVFGTPGSQAHGSELPLAVADGEVPNRVVVANVAGDEVAASVRNRCAQWWKINPEFAVVEQDFLGVNIAYAQPSRLGVDRWLSLLAARGQAVCVADLGTATTVDVIDRHGVHAGGLIAPGMSMMRKSLIGETAGIMDSSGSAEFFADDTGSAVANGARFATVGLLNESVQRAKRLVGADIKLILTGGNAPEVESCLSDSWVFDPLWVFRGLAQFASVTGR